MNGVSGTATVNTQGNVQTESHKVQFVELRDGMSNKKFRAAIARDITQLGLTRPVRRRASAQ